MSTERWREERDLAERVYAAALPHLRKLPELSSSLTVERFVRDEIDSGEWACAVDSILRSGHRLDESTRDEVRRMWVDGRSDVDSQAVERALAL